MKKKQKNEIVLRLKIPNIKAVFIGTLILFGLYFLTYFVVNSYAQTNGLKEKDLLNPLKWFIKEEYPKIIVPESPIDKYLTPRPTQIVETKNPNTNTNQKGQIDCVGPDGKHFQTTQVECDNFNNAWGKKPNNNPSTNTNNNKTNNNLVHCAYSSPYSNFDFGNITHEECTRKSNEYFANKNIAVPTFSPPVISNPTSVPSPSLSDEEKQRIIDQNNALVTKCRNYLTEDRNELLRRCAITYGGSSAAEVCMNEVDRQYRRDIENCGTLY